MSAWLAVALVLLPTQTTVKDWTVKREEINPKTKSQEVSAIVHGDEAVLLDSTPGKEIADLRGVKATYYTEPAKEGDKSEAIRLEARQGRLDRPADYLKLTDQARVTREDGTVTESSEVYVDFKKKTITAREKVRMVRSEPNGRTTVLTADSVDALASGLDDPSKRQGKPQAEHVSARGNIRLEDDKGTRAVADALEWEFKDDVARLSGAPLVEVEQGRNKVKARRVEIMRNEGHSTFHEEVSTELPSGEEPEARPLKLTSRTLVTRAVQTPTGREVSEIEAQEGVRLEGLMEREGQAPGVAEADRFVWNALERRGLLEGAPFVRVVQGGNTTLAPKIVLEGRSTAVLKGPKSIRLSSEREGKNVSFRASAEGDIVIDSAAGRITMSDRCSVRTDEFRLTADRMLILLAKDGKEIETVRAFGDVRAHRPRDGVTVYGDRLHYDPAAQTLSVTGAPYAVADRGRQIAYQRLIRFDEKKKQTEMRDGTPYIIIYEQKR